MKVLTSPRSLMLGPWLVLMVPAAMALIAIIAFIMSMPGHLSQRMADIEAKAQAANLAADSPGDLKAFPAGSVCSGEVTDAMKAQLNSALINTGLKIDAFDVSDAGRSGTLQTYRLALKGSGTYEDALVALNAMRNYRPKIFLDTLALRNRISDVQLDIGGRMFCR